MVRILPSSDTEAALWRTTLEVAELFRGWPWVIICGQSVMLLAHERGRPAGRTTGDIDVVLDIRIVVVGSREAASRLVEAGFEPSAEHPHRFVRGTDQVDLLAPDHLGPNADLTTVPPQTTSEIPGGTRALATRHELEIDVIGVGTGTVPVPSLAGALVIKVRAWQSRCAARDLEDIVRLRDLVADAAAVRGDLKVGERRRLGEIIELRDARHPAWRVARDPLDAQAAFARLISWRWGQSGTTPTLIDLTGANEGIIAALSAAMTFDAKPGWPNTPAFLRLYVTDCDATYHRARQVAGSSLTAPSDMPSGRLCLPFRDPLGNLSWIMTHVEDVDPEEGWR